MRLRLILIAFLVVQLAACAISHTPDEYKHKSKRTSKSYTVSEDYNVLTERLRAQVDKCFAKLSGTTKGYGGDKVEEQFGIQYRVQSDIKSSIFVPHTSVGTTIGIKVSSLDSYMAIVELEKISAGTELTVYTRNLAVSKAFRLWVEGKSKACPRV